MPNRILKETVCTSRSVEALSWFEEVFFYRLIVNCDDFGRLDARPRVLRARLFPLRELPERTVAAALGRLEALGIIRRYELDGLPYLEIVHWSRHQTIRNKRSKFPEPPALETLCSQAGNDRSQTIFSSGKELERGVAGSYADWRAT